MKSESFAEEKPAHFWRSLVLGREVLQLGLHWQVGNRACVRVIKDPRLARPRSLKPITQPTEHNANLRVNELINSSSGELNKEALVLHLLPITIEHIRGFALFLYQQDDCLIWHFETTENHTVWSGYNLATRSVNDQSCSYGHGLSLCWKALGSSMLEGFGIA